MIQRLSISLGYLLQVSPLCYPEQFNMEILVPEVASVWELFVQAQFGTGNQLSRRHFTEVEIERPVSLVA